MKQKYTEQQKIFITVGATLLVVGLAWFGIKHQASVFSFKPAEVVPAQPSLVANPIQAGDVLGQEDSTQLTNPLEGIYVNPFAE